MQGKFGSLKLHSWKILRSWIVFIFLLHRFQRTKFAIFYIQGTAQRYLTASALGIQTLWNCGFIHHLHANGTVRSFNSILVYYFFLFRHEFIMYRVTVTQYSLVLTSIVTCLLILKIYTYPNDLYDVGRLMVGNFDRIYNYLRGTAMAAWHDLC